jgi:hypothetical protein
MGDVYETIDAKMAKWLGAQPVFFVATAPLSPSDHLNVSPKGQSGTFAVLDPTTVAYLDYFGSGVETIAHLRENGRIVIMFCAFDQRPKVLRLYGKGRTVFPDDAEFVVLRGRFAKTREHAVRSIIVVDLDRIADSCGYGVPLMQPILDRDVLDLYQLNKPAEYFEEYAHTKNAESIDGLPAIG